MDTLDKLIGDELERARNTAQYVEGNAIEVAVHLVAALVYALANVANAVRELKPRA